MQEYVRHFAEWGAAIIEIIGIGVITATTAVALAYLIWKAVTRAPTVEAYQKVRMLLAKGVLLGLEFLVAADIIHTVAVDLTFSSAGVLAIIVLIRTFLSFTLELELTGKWPWQKPKSQANENQCG